MRLSDLRWGRPDTFVQASDAYGYVVDPDGFIYKLRRWRRDSGQDGYDLMCRGSNSKMTDWWFTICTGRNRYGLDPLELQCFLSTCRPLVDTSNKSK